MKRLLLLTAIIATITTTAQVNPNQQPVPKRCTYMNKDNVQCHNPAKQGLTVCFLHDTTGRCTGFTKEHLRCKHKGKYNGKCWQHIYQ